MSRRFHRPVALLATTIALFASAAAAQPAATRRATIQSKILGEERHIRVALPANYATARQRYPVVYLLDGHVRAFFELAVASTGYDLLGNVRDFAIPPQIVVAVEHPDRGADLGRNADAFMKYLTDEVAPYVEKNFRALPYRLLIGHSLGGRFALMASCRAPGFFQSVVAVSPGGGDSTAYRTITDCLRSDWSTNRGTLRQLFVSSGEREARIDEGAKRLRAFLRDSAPPTVRWQYLDGPGLAHTETPYLGIPAGIKFAWDRSVWEMPGARADSLVDAKGDPDEVLRAWYAELSARTGVAIPPSPQWLDLAAAAHQRRGDAAAAERTARRLVADYPEFLGGYARLADLLVAKRDIDGARRVLDDAVRALERLEFFDATERSLKRKVLVDALARLNARERDRR